MRKLHRPLPWRIRLGPPEEGPVPMPPFALVAQHNINSNNEIVTMIVACIEINPTMGLVMALKQMKSQDGGELGPVGFYLHLSLRWELMEWVLLGKSVLRHDV